MPADANEQLRLILAQADAHQQAADSDYSSAKKGEAKAQAARAMIADMASKGQLAHQVTRTPADKRTILALLKAGNAEADRSGLNFRANTSHLEQEIADEDAAKAAAQAKVASQMPAGPVTDATAVAATPQYPPARALDPSQPTVLPPGSDPYSVRLGYSGTGPEAMDLGTSTFRQGLAESNAAGDEIDAQRNQLIEAQRQGEGAISEQMQTDAAENSELSTQARERAQLAETHANQIKEMQQAAQAQTDAQMARIRQASDEAANAQLKNFWADKSTGARIMGIISQALAGAANGLAGQPGAPTPLDKIIDRDLEVQRTNLNQKVTTSYREQGILGVMQGQFKSQVDANLAAYQASLGHVSALVEDIKQRYNTPAAIAAADKAQADLKAKSAQALTQVANAKNQSALQKMQVAAPLIRSAESANAAVESAQLRAQGQGNDQHIIGLKGPVNKQVFGKLAEHAGAVSSLMSSYNEFDKLLAPNAQIGEEWLENANRLRGVMVAALRTTDHTGAALNKMEAENLETRIPQFTKSMLGHISPKQIFDYQKIVRGMKQTVLRDWASRLRAVSTADYDLNDPLIGGDLKGLAMGPRGG